MPIIYTDTTNKYDISTTALKEAALSKGLLDFFMATLAPVENAINDGFNIIGKWVSDWQLNKNVRRRDEMGHLLDSDRAAYDAEGGVNFIILIVCVLVIFIFFAKNEK